MGELSQYMPVASQEDSVSFRAFLTEEIRLRNGSLLECLVFLLNPVSYILKIFPLFSLNSYPIKHFGEEGIWSICSSTLPSPVCLHWWAQGKIIFLERDRHKQKFSDYYSLTLITFPSSLFLMSVEPPLSCNNNMLEDLRSVRRLERDCCVLCRRVATVFKMEIFFYLFRTLNFSNKASSANWRHLIRYKIWTSKLGGNEWMEFY